MTLAQNEKNYRDFLPVLEHFGVDQKLPLGCWWRNGAKKEFITMDSTSLGNVIQFRLLERFSLCSVGNFSTSSFRSVGVKLSPKTSSHDAFVPKKYFCSPHARRKRTICCFLSLTSTHNVSSSLKSYFHHFHARKLFVSKEFSKSGSASSENSLCSFLTLFAGSSPLIFIGENF